ncbi:MAG: efflux RND transporter periplasmic adaptor subunit [Bacteroidetes bacterium]|uniref:Efflux RND transporter periplasmic adaptor subunit n=1 Tax=Candidatus Pullibacteroides excrementavium TaxID=2840905 RepID=A0A9D9DQH9_9BACT|nr:efflux RND transporter periplasmic adaptor subunit [Candidatus Pullibacteroides excrementavium]
MKHSALSILGMAATLGLLASCQDSQSAYDAGGTLEATTMTLSAQGNGLILSLPIEEGQKVDSAQTLGWIDTVQLSLQKELLEAGLPSGRRKGDPRYTAQEIQLAQVEDMLDKCRISVPTQGVVLEKYAQAGEQAYMGRPLLKVADLDKMYVRVYLSATQLESLKLGQEVEVFSKRDGKETAYKGRIRHISDQAEFTPKSVQTQDERDNLVYAVRIAVENDGYLKIGMYANVNF